MTDQPVTPPNFRVDPAGEDNNGDLNFLLPSDQVIGPDRNGIKKVIKYKFSEEGQKVIRVTSKFQVRKILLSKQEAKRRSWLKFGDAANEVSNIMLTNVSPEEIFLERPNPNEETKTSGDSLEQLRKRGGALIRCRTCGKKSEHWTFNCSYKELAPHLKVHTRRVSSTDGSSAFPGIYTKTYVPSGMKAEAKSSTEFDMRHRDDGNSLRVGGLSEETCKSDLDELFSPFGPLSRVFVAIDQRSGLCRGFGYVTFVHKEDAKRAIDKLHRYGYDNRILEVGWANQDLNKYK